MVVGISTFELHLPASRGLKEKRKVVKGLIDRLHARFRISIAETDHHDLLQRAEITIAVVAQREDELEHLFDELRASIDSIGPEAVLSFWEPQILEAR